MWLVWAGVCMGAMLLELSTPMQQHKILDCGFLFVDKYLGGGRLRQGVAASVNTLLLTTCNVYLLREAYVHGLSPVVQGSTLLFLMRAVVGWCTRLPVPVDFVSSAGEFPPAGYNFFFLFSAHTTTVSTVGLHLYRIYGWGVGGVFVALLGWQSARLLVTRGHYTSDILVGLLLSWLMDHYTHSAC